MEEALDHDMADSAELLTASYVLPIAAQTSQVRALSGYLLRLSRSVDEVIVVDGSPQETFDAHARAWAGHVRHLRPAFRTTNGKVAGVMTGIRAARHERVIVADDDVRYRLPELVRMLALLSAHDVVRPQNFFHPLPWHARWDTARSLLTRLGDGDWPGTLGVKRSMLLAVGGYSGEVLFENLELVRTMRAAGGREAVPLDLFVARRPPDAAHFLSQRTRQAYDEWARPARFAAQLALLPAGILLARRGPGWLLAAAVCTMAAAEIGRRKGMGQTVFPPSSALWTPAWLAERAVTSWMALGTRLLFGGVRYRDTRLKNAATSPRILEMKMQRDAASKQRPWAFNRKRRPCVGTSEWPQVENARAASGSRVMSIATLQKQLAVSQLETVELRTYFADLCGSISASMIDDPQRITLETDGDDTHTKSDVSVSMGLIVTELVINAIKHAFPDQASVGKITVSFAADEDAWLLAVSDNGAGMPVGEEPGKAGLGTGIVEALAKQLDASVTILKADPGTRVEVRHGRQ